MFSVITKPAAFRKLAAANWKSALTVAFISVPLSIALSIASGAGPVPGLITGIWATAIAAFFCSNSYNVIGAAGALTTVLFAAQMEAPSGIGAAALPLVAVATGLILLALWALGAEKFLYYIPSSVMHGFAAGVAFAIAASQLFDATGLSALERTGTFGGDVALYIAHAAQTDLAALSVFAAALAGILLWKRFVPQLPAVIPAATLGIVFGYAQQAFHPLGITLLSDKFGALSGAVAAPFPLAEAFAVASSPHALYWLFHTAGVVALIAVLETLITAKLADRITHTESSSSREVFGLALANIGAGVAGGLPATGVFIRTGANIQAGATHRVSALLVAVFTALIALVVLPSFSYMPAAVVAAILVNTALGLIELDVFREYWQHEKESFAIMALVAVMTVMEDAGMAVVIGAVIALLIFANRVSRGRFDAFLTFEDGRCLEMRGRHTLAIPREPIAVLTYSLAGYLGYIDSSQHAANFRHIARSDNVRTVIIRLRNLFSIDHEGREMLADAARELARRGKEVHISSVSEEVRHHLTQIEPFAALEKEGRFASKTEDVLADLGVKTA